MTNATEVGTQIAGYAAIVAVGAPILWAVSEALGKLLGVKESIVSAVAGPVLSLLFLAFGWLPVLPVIAPEFTTPVNVIWAVLMGFAAAGGSKVLNDKLLRPRGFKLPKRD